MWGEGGQVYQTTCVESVAKTAGKLSKGPEQQPMEVNNMTKVRKNVNAKIIYIFDTHFTGSHTSEGKWEMCPNGWLQVGKGLKLHPLLAEERRIRRRLFRHQRPDWDLSEEQGLAQSPKITIQK